MHQIAIWDIPSFDLGCPKLRFGALSQIAIWDKVRFGLQRSPKSKCGFGISQIAIWEIIGFGLQQRYYNSSKLSNSSTMQIVYFEVEIIDKENMGTYSFLCLYRINTFNIC